MVCTCVPHEAKRKQVPGHRGRTLAANLNVAIQTTSAQRYGTFFILPNICVENCFCGSIIGCPAMCGCNSVRSCGREQSRNGRHKKDTRQCGEHRRVSVCYSSQVLAICSATVCASSHSCLPFNDVRVLMLLCMMSQRRSLRNVPNVRVSSDGRLAYLRTTER